MPIDRRFAVFWACVALFVVVSLSHCVSDATTPLVVTDGGTVTGEGSTIGAYSVSGTVQGLSANGSVTLTLNGEEPLAATNGPFAFPAVLSSGQAYTVAATGAITPGYSCAIMNGAGTIVSANVTGVVVSCGSADATLKGLSIAAGPLSPTFAPATLAYTAPAHVPAVFSTPMTTTTVTATSNDPGAKITIAGALTPSGSPSAPLALNVGANAIDVTVTAGDGMSQKHYAIAVTGTINDYLKAQTPVGGADFGTHVSLSTDGNTLAVSAPFEVSGGFSGAVYVFARAGGAWAQQARLLASNAGPSQLFGHGLALSADGNTLAVGAHLESSNAMGVNTGDQSDTSATHSGAAYVFVRTGTAWTQQAYVKASNTTAGAIFGWCVGLSGDGNTLAVGSLSESSSSVGINGVQSDTSAAGAGAVYVFARAMGVWSQQAYVKASNTHAGANFGGTVALSGDGSTMAVGALAESSDATDVNASLPMQMDTSMPNAGAVYVFTRATTTWSQQAYVKASNTRASALFGAVALSSDGNTLAVGSSGESSNALGIGGIQSDTSAGGAGAVYVFLRAGTTWAQQIYIKASNTGTNQSFGGAVALSTDGNDLLVGSPQENSDAKGINGTQSDTSTTYSGAAYVFTRTGTAWLQKGYVKSSNTAANQTFGSSVSIFGSVLAVGASGESSNASGVNGDQTDTSLASSGAVYVF